jgi:hypothetical protein
MGQSTLLPLQLLLGLGLSLSASDEFHPNFRAESTLMQARIRADIFSREGFDRILPPTSNRSESGDHYSNAGTTVSIQIRFFKVQEVNAVEGTMRLKIWMRLGWQDERLKWNASLYGGVTTTWFQAHHYPGAEENEIWVPDIQPYNANQGFVTSLEPSLAPGISRRHVQVLGPGRLPFRQPDVSDRGRRVEAERWAAGHTAG